MALVDCAGRSPPCKFYRAYIRLKRFFVNLLLLFKIAIPESAGNCKRKWGMFPASIEKCGQQYYNCVDGINKNFFHLLFIYFTNLHSRKT